MRESFDHPPPGWIGQSGKCCAQFIHNHMVVDFPSMSSVNFAIPDLRSLNPVTPALIYTFPMSGVIAVWVHGLGNRLPRARTIKVRTATCAGARAGRPRGWLRKRDSDAMIYLASTLPMLIRLSAITPSPTHRFMPAAFL
jgi:hypothetical protein